MMRAVQILVAIGLLALVFYMADGATAMRMLATANPLWLLASVLALTLQAVLSALRWRLTAAQLGIPLARAEALREYYLSQIVNQTLPGGVIGDAARAVRTRQVAGLMASGQAVVFERLAGQIALFVVMALAFSVTWLLPGGLDWPDWAASPLAIVVMLGLALPVALWVIARLLPLTAARQLRVQGRSLYHALAAPDVRLRQAVLSVGTVLLNVAAFGFCAWSVGVGLPVAAIFAVVPLILFAMVVPVTISGWGLREGAAAALFPIAGASASDGLASSVAFGLVFLATALPGAVLVGLDAGRAKVKL